MHVPWNPEKKKTLIYILLGFSIIPAILAFIWFYDIPNNSDKKDTKPVKDRATVSIEPLLFSQETENKSRFLLSADKSRFFQNEGKGILKNFSFTYFYDGGKKITISGPKAVVDLNVSSDLSTNMNLANIYSKEKVTVVSSEGYRFETRKLFWDGYKKFITTDEPIVFYGEKFKVTGEGLKADIDNEKMEIEKKVDVVLIPEALSDLTSGDNGVKEPQGGKI